MIVRTSDRVEVLSKMTEATPEPTAVSDDYWTDARRPLSSLIFLLPWIGIYEFGVLFLSGAQSDPGNADRIRNGADYWMRSWLTGFGFSQVLFLPVIVMGALLLWHVVKRYPWRIRFETIAGMLAESLLLAIGLVAAGQLHDAVFRWARQNAVSEDLTLMAVSGGTFNRAISFIGAGVYEEVMFRLLLVPIAFLGFRMFEFPPRPAAVMAAISTGFLFALAHHVGPAADAFNLFTFSFRASAGVFFATVFFLRGIGITVGCHAVYDLIVGVLLVSE